MYIKSAETIFPKTKSNSQQKLLTLEVSGLNVLGPDLDFSFFFVSMTETV